MVAKIQIEPLTTRPFPGTILFPPVVSVAQADMMMLLSRAGKRVMALAGDRPVSAKRLHFIPNLIGRGFAPNPGLGPFFDSLAQLLGKSNEPPQRKIYIARRDSSYRTLHNEEAVINLVKSYGFEIVELTGLKLCDQARLFASASHVIAPHGAGLTNIVFCTPGASLCELQMDAYMNPCFRRIAGIRDLNYGCLVGTSEGSSSVHQRRWSVSLDKLDVVLNDARFMRAPKHAEKPAQAP